MLLNDEFNLSQFEIFEKDDIKKFFCCHTNLASCNLNAIHLNIRSLRKNFDDFILYLGYIETKIHIIILSEIWISDSEINLYKIKNYGMYVKCRSYNRSGGIIIYIHNEFTFDYIPTNDITAETLILCNQTLKLMIIAMYRSHDYSISDFLIELENKVKNNRDFNVILVGDINIDILTQNNDTCSYLNLLANYGFYSMINDVTFFGHNSQSCLDHIFTRTKNDEIFITTGIHKFEITDHYPICFKINLSFLEAAITINHSKKRMCEKFFYDIDIFKQFIYNYDKILFMEKNDANTNFMNIVDMYIKGIKVSRKIQATSHTNKRDNEWITRDLIDLINKKEKAYKKFRKDRFNLILKESYDRINKELKNKIRMAKNQFYMKKFTDSEGNTKNQWKIINNIIGKKNKESVLPCTVSDFDLAENFNTFFIDIAKNNCNSLNDVICFPTNQNSLVLEDVNDQDILNAFSKLKSNSAPGIDGLTVKQMGIILQYKIYDVRCVINQSFKEGIFFNYLKTIKVIPIFKNGNKEDLSNYRPISLLSNFSKLIENIIKKKFMCFIDKYHILSPHQYGFRSNLSTEHAILNFTSRVVEAIDVNINAAAISIDISKAFDTVNHRILFKKLAAYGIRGPALALIQDYLCNRKQTVFVNKCYSNKLLITAGVPQGSVLGPLLFLLYINDLCSSNFSNMITSYADDTVLLYLNENFANLISDINFGLKKVNNWFFKNCLNINYTKTILINFNLRKQEQIDVRIHSVTCNYIYGEILCNCPRVKQVSSFKYLGVYIDCNFGWKSHLHYITSRLHYFLKLHSYF